MKKHTTPIFLFVLVAVLTAAYLMQSRTTYHGGINPVIGDESFLETYGYSPTDETDEQLRIQTHLKYVESRLRQIDVSHLTDDQRKHRLAMLDQLKLYWKSARFPTNAKYVNERKPCFIDQKGRICAVGYLIEQSMGRALAESINQQFQYNTIMEMNLPLLVDWADRFGFTLTELATIQPQYGPSTQVEKEYAFVSSLFNGVNVATSAISLSNGGLSNSKTMKEIGIVVGLGTMALGTYHTLEPTNPNGGNHRHQNLSMLNIVLGSATCIVNAYQLHDQNKRARASQIGLFTVPDPKNRLIPGVSYTLRF